MLAQARDDVEREIGALELRIGIEDDRNIDGVGDGAEIAFDLRLGEREIGFENGENAAGAEFLVTPRLVDRVPRRGGRDAGHHRHAAGGGFDGRAHHVGALHGPQISEFAGRAERRDAVHAGFDQIVDQFARAHGS